MHDFRHVAKVGIAAGQCPPHIPLTQPVGGRLMALLTAQEAIYCITLCILITLEGVSIVRRQSSDHNLDSATVHSRQ